MEIKFKLDQGAKLPTRAHETDAGLDLYARSDFMVKADSYEVHDTGVHVQLPIMTVGMLKSKSGLNMRYSILGEGVIDSGYTGSIVVKLYNHGNYDKVFRAGDKITQLVILPYVYGIPVEVDTLEETDRGDAGFGSSGR